MHTLTASERQILETIQQQSMLDQVLSWSAVNSGSGNLNGLAETANMLAEAFSVLPGEITLIDPEPVDRVLTDGSIKTAAHGQHLLVTVRADAPTQLLFTGHMDTVFPADHEFQNWHWLEDGALNGPGVADMKGGNMRLDHLGRARARGWPRDGQLHLHAEQVSGPYRNIINTSRD